jgi:Flp pilus assembly protein TadG
VIRRSDQRGQSLVLVVISLTVLLGMAALVLDLGMGWYAKRQLQASVDAAALAGAQELPSSANAVARAHEYILKNPTRGVDAVQDTIITKCLASAPGCAPVNAVQVSAKANAETAFARVFGINSMTVGAKATACQPCGAKPLDIVIVLDRTGSMLQGGSPSKIENAKTGIMTFLSFLDAGTALVGLTVLPPSPNLAGRCASGSYDLASSVYTIVPLSNDFKVNGVINNGSNLVQTINCMVAAGTTHYSLAIQAAQAELNLHGRAGVQDVIVFLTDGAANTGPHFGPYANPAHTERTQPCHSGITSAAAAKATGTWIYTIGYSIGGDDCLADRQAGAEAPFITPDQALSAMASNPGNYYVRPDTGQLNTIFTQVAADISAGSSRLVDDGWG